MKKIYSKPFLEIVEMQQESSLLAAFSKGQVESEAPDSGLNGAGEIAGGGNGDDQDAAKNHNAWSNWDE